MIDYPSLKEHIRFTIQHYGTRTQGEAHRLDLVAECLTETFIRLLAYDKALSNIADQFPQDHPASFAIKVR